MYSSFRSLEIYAWPFFAFSLMFYENKIFILKIFIFILRKNKSPLRCRCFLWFRCLSMDRVYPRRMSRSFCSWNREFFVRTPHAKASHIAEWTPRNVEWKTIPSASVTLMDPLNHTCCLSTGLRFLVGCRELTEETTMLRTIDLSW